MIAAISDAPESWMTTLALRKLSGLWTWRSWRMRSDWANGLSHKRQLWRREIQCDGIDKLLCGIDERSNPSYRTQRIAELVSGFPWTLWYIHPEIMTKEGFPGVGKAHDDSNAAKEKMGFNRRERWEILGSLMKALYSSGKEGSDGIRVNLFPCGPQQKPEFLLVSRRTLQVLCVCITLQYLVPHWRFGEEIVLICHMRLFEVCNTTELSCYILGYEFTYHIYDVQGDVVNGVDTNWSPVGWINTSTTHPMRSLYQPELEQSNQQMCLSCVGSAGVSVATDLGSQMMRWRQGDIWSLWWNIGHFNTS